MIASPTDVAEERREVELALTQWNRHHGERRGVLVVPWRWEIDAVPELRGGPGQSVINTQGVDTSDVVIAVFGNRLGSQTQNAISGTVEELDRARAAGKPVHVYFSEAPIPRSADFAQLERLNDFRARLGDLGLHGSYTDLDDLREKVVAALSHDVDVLMPDGDHPRGDARYFERNLKDRVFELLSIDWVLTPSTSRPDTWDGRATQHRRILSRSRMGISQIAISLSRATERDLPFDGHELLGFTLLPGWSRSDVDADADTLTLSRPRKNRGSSFVQDVRLRPSLPDGARVDFEVSGTFPNYKHAFCNDVFEATIDSQFGGHDWEAVSFTIGHPTAHFHYSVFLPDVLGAEPIGPKIGPSGQVDSEATAAVVESGQYRQQREVVDGMPGIRLSLDVPHPRVNYVHRISWRAPVRPHA